MRLRDMPGEAWRRLHDSLFPCVKKKHCIYRVLHTVGHGTYFAAAAHEGVGLYANASIFLLGMMIIGLIWKEDEP